MNDMNAIGDLVKSNFCGKFGIIVSISYHAYAKKHLYKVMWSDGKRNMFWLIEIASMRVMTQS